MMFRIALFAFAVLSASPLWAQSCGDPDTPCDLPDGSYHIAVPEGVDRPGIFVFLHGSNGHGRSARRNAGFVERVGARGYALLSPTGAPQGPGGGRDWSVRDGLDDTRDDIDFLRRVIDDAAQRFDLDRDRVILTGFSRGGSMVWDVACAAPDMANAYAATAGAFWEPFVETCVEPVRLHHSHGFTDKMVPLEGRKGVWQGFSFHQGNVLKAVDIWRRTNGCEGRASTSMTPETELWEKHWADCADGEIVLRIWPGGHGMPKGWSGDVIDWFESQ